ncbi:MAG: MarR family winged helix-turn-helix transcriptional regulator [Acidimicrobiales bacterium]
MARTAGTQAWADIGGTVRAEPAKAGLNRGELAASLMDAISSVRRASRRHAGQVVALASVTGAEMELLRALRRHPGGSVAEMASELGLAPNTVSTMVGRLAAAGVVQRQVDAVDRRVARLTISPGVAQGIWEWLDRRAGALSVALAELAPADQAALAGAVVPLQRLAQVLETTARALGEGAQKAGTATRARGRRAGVL